MSSSVNNQNTLTKQIIEYADGCFFCNIQLPIGFEGELIMDAEYTKVLLEQSFRKSMYGEGSASEVVLNITGQVNINHVLFVELKTALKNVWKYLLESQGQDDYEIISVVPKGEAIIVTKRIFVLPYAVMPEFFDVNNNEAKPVFDLCRYGKWSSFFLRKQPEFL